MYGNMRPTMLETQQLKSDIVASQAEANARRAKDLMAAKELEKEKKKQKRMKKV